MSLPHMVNLDSVLTDAELQRLLDEAEKDMVAWLDFADHAYGVGVLVFVEIRWEPVDLTLPFPWSSNQHLTVRIGMPDRRDAEEEWVGHVSIKSSLEFATEVGETIAMLLDHLPYRAPFFAAMEEAKLAAHLSSVKGKGGGGAGRL